MAWKAGRRGVAGESRDVCEKSEHLKMRAWPSTTFPGRLAFCITGPEKRDFWDDESRKNQVVLMMKEMARGIPTVLYDGQGQLLYCSESERLN